LARKRRIRKKGSVKLRKTRKKMYSTMASKYQAKIRRNHEIRAKMKRVLGRGNEGAPLSADADSIGRFWREGVRSHQGLAKN